MFHHPFQASRGLSGSLPATSMTPETPLSPRAAHATFLRAADLQHDEGRGEGTISTSYVVGSGSGYHSSQFRNGPGDSYWGAFPPNQQGTHLLPHISMSEPYRRDSTTSMGYEVPILYGDHGDGLPHPNMHVEYHSSQ